MSGRTDRHGAGTGRAGATAAGRGNRGMRPHFVLTTGENAVDDNQIVDRALVRMDAEFDQRQVL